MKKKAQSATAAANSKKASNKAAKKAAKKAVKSAARKSAKAPARTALPSPAEASASPAVSEPATPEVRNFRHALEANLYRLRGQPIQTASRQDLLAALIHTVRDRVVPAWRRTVNHLLRHSPKFVAYLSAEYLPGRQLEKNLLYTGLTQTAREAVAQLGYDLEDLFEIDSEPALGNGGLGRLAACLLDSAATLDLPVIGYGIRYEYGIFRQAFDDGWQVERPDDWLRYGDPAAEFRQPDDAVEIGFGGRTESFTDRGGRYRVRWLPEERVLGEPSHGLVPGFRSQTVNVFRLWRARASQDFDLRLFEAGDYIRAVEQKVRSETLSKVLYPNDSTPQGKELRLRQQYFFVACSLHDVLRTVDNRGVPIERLPDAVVIQLNDTHPAIAIAELMRVLIDLRDIDWDTAWDVTVRTFASTQHTLMPESLEKWPVSLVGRLLPRHLEIIYEINERFLDEVRSRYGADEERVRRLSLIEEAQEKQVRMAHLACVGSFSVNGVAKLQSRLLRERVMTDFAELWPHKFGNKTNGVSPRRFLDIANPRLAKLITSRIGVGWQRDLEELRELEKLESDERFREAWREVKSGNKQRLAAWIEQVLQTKVDPSSMFDVMAKRLHEYKRQLLKALHIVTLYNRIKADPEASVRPRTFLFAGKAAPGYARAKLIIKLINAVAGAINADDDVRERIKVVFLPDFNVTLGERVYPAADLSEQISTAGTEASGTGNMKFALNGALTVGTLDGANIEIRERVGAENFFLFGLTAEEAFDLKANGYRPRERYEKDGELRAAVDAIAGGAFSGGDKELFRPIVDSLLGHDEYLVLADYRSYVDKQDEIDRAFKDWDAWTRASILNVARCGYFSSDRTIREYAEEIWKIQPLWR